METKNKSNIEVTTLSPVSPEEKKSWLSVAFMQAGIMICVPSLLLGSILAQAAHRQHIAIRPAAGAGHALPGLAPVKHIVQLVPPVPKIAGHTPHLGMAAQMGQIGNICRAGREG